MGALLSPFVILSAYLAAAGPGEARYGGLDLLVYVLSVAAGAACLAATPIPQPVRGLLVAIYVPVFGCLVAWNYLAYVCVAFDECL